MSPLSSTLTHLQLDCTEAEHRPLQQLFLESLETMLRLETLKLSACLPLFSDKFAAQILFNNPLFTPNLDEGFCSTITPVFCSVQISQKSVVRIGLNHTTQESDEDLRSLFSALKASWVSSQDMDSNAADNLLHSEILSLEIADNSMADYDL